MAESIVLSFKEKRELPFSLDCVEFIRYMNDYLVACYIKDRKKWLALLDRISLEVLDLPIEIGNGKEYCNSDVSFVKMTSRTTFGVATTVGEYICGVQRLQYYLWSYRITDGKLQAVGDEVRVARGDDFMYPKIHCCYDENAKKDVIVFTAKEISRTSIFNISETTEFPIDANKPTFVAEGAVIGLAGNKICLSTYPRILNIYDVCTGKLYQIIFSSHKPTDVSRFHGRSAQDEWHLIDIETGRKQGVLKRPCKIQLHDASPTGEIFMVEKRNEYILHTISTPAYYIKIYHTAFTARIDVPSLADCARMTLWEEKKRQKARLADHLNRLTV